MEPTRSPRFHPRTPSDRNPLRCGAYEVHLPPPPVSRTQTKTPPPLASELSLESYSDDELETLLFPSNGDERAGAAKTTIPTVMGFATLAMGVMYVLGSLANALPFGTLFPRLDFFVWPVLMMALAVIVATATGLFDRSKKRRGPKIRRAGQTGGFKIGQLHVGDGKKQLVKSNDRVISGVAGGLAEYFGTDPKVMRVALVILTAVTQGALIPVYLVLAAVLPKAPTMSLEERIRTIRDS